MRFFTLISDLWELIFPKKHILIHWESEERNWIRVFEINKGKLDSEVFAVDYDKYKKNELLIIKSMHLHLVDNQYHNLSEFE